MMAPQLPPLDAWLVVAIGFAAIKVISTIMQLAWPGGAIELTRSRFGRLLYIAGKASPIGLVGALLIRAIRSGSADSVPLTWGLIATCALVAVVVTTRVKGRWHGLAHWLRSKGNDNAH